MVFLLWTLLILAATGVVVLGASVRVIKQYERGVVYRLGRVLSDPRRPGLALLIPFVERLQKVNMQIITLPCRHRTASPATTSPCAWMPSSTSE